MAQNTTSIPGETISGGQSLPASAVAFGARVGGFRWAICGLLFFGTAINYIDRQVLGVLKPLLSHDLHWSERGYADIVTAFQFAYACGYLFGGRLMDTIGVKRGLGGAALVWSVAAAAHGLARSVLGFSVARLILGVSEGGNFPAAIRVVSEWFPLRERALATGVFNSASNIGAILCPLSLPWLAVHAGWPAAFFITGALGLVWVLAWALLYDSPERHPKLAHAERAYIEEVASLATPVDASIPWSVLLKHRASWAYMLANLLATPVWWFYLFWIPDFLSKRFHLDVVTTGKFTGMIYFIAVFGSIGGGWFSTYLLKRGMSLNSARKTALLVPAMCVVPVCLAATVPSIWAASLLVGLAAAAHQAWSANLYTFVSDVMPKRAVGSVVGLGGFTSGLAAMVVAQAVGAVLATTGSYVPLFIWASSMYLVSLLIIQLLVPRIEPWSLAQAAN